MHRFKTKTLRRLALVAIAAVLKFKIWGTGDMPAYHARRAVRYARLWRGMKPFERMPDAGKFASPWSDKLEIWSLMWCAPVFWAPFLTCARNATLEKRVTVRPYLRQTPHSGMEN